MEIKVQTSYEFPFDFKLNIEGMVTIKTASLGRITTASITYASLIAPMSSNHQCISNNAFSREGRERIEQDLIEIAESDIMIEADLIRRKKRCPVDSEATEKTCD